MTARKFAEYVGIVILILFCGFAFALFMGML
jgi:hypothetical protein